MISFLKYARIGLICIWRVIFDYFAWILPYSRHPEKYPLEKRYRKARSLILYLLRHYRYELRLINPEILTTDKPVVYVANHLSALDPLMLIALSPRPVSFIAKKEAKKIPAAGRLITAIDGLFLDRDDPFQAVKLFRQAVKNMEETGISYGIFPEGTRNKDPYSARTLEFHPGALKLAYKAKCPIRLYAQFGSFHAMDNVAGRSHLWTIRGVKSIEYENYQDVKSVLLATHLRSQIEEYLPSLVQEDKKYYDTKQQKHRPSKWQEKLAKTE